MCATATDVTAETEFSPYLSKPVLLVFKRLFDVILTGLLLLFLAPLFLVLAIAVKVTSRGTVFYRWQVVGKGGRPFVGYKFRSMYQNADLVKLSLEHLNEMQGPVFKISNDPRVTSVGRWMRRYSLDELPQLYSVLKGDMSLVGPRPPLVTEYAQFNEFQKKKMAVKPGITCLWQVSGRNAVSDFDDWVSLDLEYIRRWTPQLDLLILFKTIGAVFSGTGR